MGFDLTCSIALHMPGQFKEHIHARERAILSLVHVMKSVKKKKHLVAFCKFHPVSDIIFSTVYS